jgi:cyclase
MKMLPRIIPVLLNSNSGVVKTKKFRSRVYIGDAINIVKIFNDKEVDEIAVLDIDATRYERGPNYELISQIATEAFMPMAYGGGVGTVAQIEKILKIGVEKVIINTAAINSPNIIKEASNIFGSQSIVASIDVGRSFFGQFNIYADCGRRKLKVDLLQHIDQLQENGVGEIILNSIDRDGMMNGYDLELVKKVANSVSVPVVALGGAGEPADFLKAIEAGASAVAAGSMFVFHGRHNAVLISYTKPDALFKEGQ